MSGKRIAVDVAIGVIVGSILGLVIEVPWEAYAVAIALSTFALYVAARMIPGREINNDRQR